MPNTYFSRSKFRARLFQVYKRITRPSATICYQVTGRKRLGYHVAWY